MNQQEALQLAQQAGFSGQSAHVVVAIAQAESNLDPQARGMNSDGSVDRGILQINSRWHPEVPDSCAYDATCSFQQAYRISGGGQSFTAWSTYNEGTYQKYLLSASSASTGTTGSWQDQLITMAEKVAVFIMGLLMAFLGFYILNQKAVRAAMGKGTQAAQVAAMAG